MGLIVLIGSFSVAIWLILPQATDAITGDFWGVFPGNISSDKLW
jgi:hypothetical protein